jgi:dihydropyrimidine dehydrogenase (NAD+) subunit PreA
MEKATTIGIDFCGIRCENPFFLATSPAYADYDSLSRALKAGWAGVFYAMDGGGKELDLLHRLKSEYPSKVAVAALPGKKEALVAELFEKVRAAGADALQIDAASAHFLRGGLPLPLIVKDSSITESSLDAYLSGAGAITIDTRQSTSKNSRNAVHHILKLSSNPILKGLDLSGICDVCSWRNALELLQAGCSTIQVHSDGSPDVCKAIAGLVSGLGEYLSEHGLPDTSSLVGEKSRKLLNLRILAGSSQD